MGYWRVFYVPFILLKYATWPAALAMGYKLLTQMTSGAKGFNFLGILFIIVGLISFILFCIENAPWREPEEKVCSFENAWCDVMLYVILLCLGFFALVVSIPGGSGKSLPGIEYKEYELSSYSKWLQNRVNDAYLWENYYKNTLIKDNVCSNMTTKYRFETLDGLHLRHLNPFEVCFHFLLSLVFISRCNIWLTLIRIRSEYMLKSLILISGCCIASEECGFNYTSPTVWIKPKDENYTNMDCYKWSNDPSTLCLDCQSCKAAFANDVAEYWFYAGIVSLVTCVITVKKAIEKLKYEYGQYWSLI
ncbi:tetraspanin-8-like [Silene latifolia]|uniref:tetraspanin-8-like n=1 Tax=Silene latifolia TaxID=37657 RepID=UPI003D781B4A